MSLSGVFVLEKNENVHTFLKTLGVSDEKIKLLSAVAGEHTLDVSLDGKNLKMVVSHGGDKCENTLVIGEPSTYRMGSGAEFQVNLCMPAGNVAKGTFELKGKKGDILIEFGGGQMTETFTFEGVVAKRVYKKK